MGKLCIIVLLFASSWCTEEKKVNVPEIAALKNLRQNQNSDGSWGNTNKVYCTSIAVLTFLCNGETPVSSLYGKSVKSAMQYLIKDHGELSKDDLDVLMWALSESFTMTGISVIEDRIYELFPTFLQSFDWDFENNPRLFFIQNEALRSSYSAGIEDDFFKTAFLKLEQINSDESLALKSSKVQWGEEFEANESFNKQLKKYSVDQSLSPLEDLMVGKILFQSHKHELVKKFKTKLELHDEFLSYKIDDRFTEGEKKLLRNSFPCFLFSYCFPARYLPSARNNYTKNKSPLEEIYEEEGLDLVE